MNHQEIFRFKKQAERMEFEMARGIATLIHSEENLSRIKEEEQEQGKIKIVATDPSLSIEESVEIIYKNTEYEKTQSKYTPEAIILNRCIPFIEEDMIYRTETPHIELGMNLTIFKEYFNKTSKGNEAPTSEETINFIEICYYAERTLEIALNFSLLLKNGKTMFIKSQNKKTSAKAKAEEILIDILKNNKDAIFSVPKNSNRCLSFNQVCENIRDQIKAKNPGEAAPTPPTVKRWLREIFDITPKNLDQLRTKIETKLENL